MGCREKLNEAYVAGSLVLAAIAGAMTGSWLVFIITAAILVACTWPVATFGQAGVGKRKDSLFYRRPRWKNRNSNTLSTSSSRSRSRGRFT